MSPLSRVAAGLVFFLAIGPAHAQTYSTESGTAEFESRVPLHTFTGTSQSLVGQIALADSTVDFYIDLETLDTGIGKRDKDMRKTLETDQFPFAEFFGKLVSPFDPSGAEQTARVRGRFKIHGVSREIEVSGTLKPVASGLELRAEWDLNLKDYRITPPSLLVIKVDEVQHIRIHATLTPVSGS